MAPFFVRAICLLAVLMPLSSAAPLVSGGKHGPDSLPRAKAQPISIVTMPNTVALFGTSSTPMAYSRVATMKGGKLLASSTAISADGTHQIVVAASPAQPLSFSKISSIATGPGDLDNAYLLELGNGRILAAYRNHDRINGAYSVFRITVSYSDDGGRSWHYLSEPVVRDAKKDGQLGVWEPLLRLAANGKVQLFCSYETSRSDQDTHLYTSANGGLTWSGPAVVTGAAQPSSRDGMVGVARASATNPAELVMVFETIEPNYPGFKVLCVYSHDDGFTWDNTRQVVYEAKTGGKNAGAPQVAYIAGQGVIATFMTDDDVPRVDWPNAAAVKAVVAPPLDSHGGKLRWQNSRPALVSSANSHWSGIQPVSGKGLVSFEQGGKAQARFVRIVS